VRLLASFTTAAFAFFSSFTFGGTIVFDPPTALVDPSTSVSTATFDVSTASSQAPAVDSVDIIIGSDDLRFVPELWESYAPWHTLIPPCDPGPCVDSEMYVGGFAPSPVVPPTRFGRLTVDTAGLAPGNYTVLVDSTRDHFSAVGLSGVGEAVFGVGHVTVVPEPSIVVLLIVGVVVVVGRAVIPRQS
jgi:hypothetical protein